MGCPPKRRPWKRSASSSRACLPHLPSDFVVDWCSTHVAVSHVRDGPSGQEACSDDWARWPSHAITLAPRPCMPGGRSARGRCQAVSSSKGKTCDGRLPSLLQQVQSRPWQDVPCTAMGRVASALCQGECRTEQAEPLQGLHTLWEVVCSSCMRICLDRRR